MQNPTSAAAAAGASRTDNPARFDREGWLAWIGRRHEPDWLIEHRREALERFLAMDWPSRTSEEWLRTDIRAFRLDRYRLPLEPPATRDSPAGLLSEGVELAGYVRSRDSFTVQEHLEPYWQERGVIFSSVEHLPDDVWELFRPYLTQPLIDPGYDRFAALQSAFWSGGRVLYVPRGVTVDRPFHSLSVLSSGATDLGRTLIILEEGSEATVMIETSSLEPIGDGFHCGATEVHVGPGAVLRLVNLQNWGHRVWHFAHQKAVVAQDASLQWTVAALGSRLAKTNQHVELVGPGANCQVNGVMFTEDRQHLSFHTLQHHAAPACKSDFLYKAALQDQSRTVWRGMIRVDHGAQKTDGYQRNDNLLLSPDVRADSIPGLEIEADDVRCTHGSTTGRIDEELLFYAQCRGLTRKEATRLIVMGFFQQVFDRITIDSVREALAAAIARRVREYAL
ncbi:MAG: Fe-S cluster assembly protein SufD [Pirellulaceae bacterium]|nr:MAG: Fe-S cluster assembly protein SufD [Pirellulaceae bacterium]